MIFSLLLFRYKERFLSSLPSDRRQTADFSMPIFPGAAFYLAARKMKVMHNARFNQAKARH